MCPSVLVRRSRRLTVLLVAFALALVGVVVVTPAVPAAPAAATTYDATARGTVRGTNLQGADIGPLPGARVTVLDAGSGQTIASLLTDSAGRFTIGGLPSWPIKIRAAKAGWSTMYALGKKTSATADQVTIPAGSTWDLPAPLVLEPEASIQGQVLGYFDPLGYATVTVFDAASGTAIRSVTADGTGNYRIGALPSGDIVVRATKPGWLPGWADGAASRATAHVYTLAPGQVLEQQWSPTMVLYLDLTPESVVEGTVTGFNQDPVNGFDGPLAGARVTVFDATTNVALGSATTDAAGHYRIGGLAQASIVIRATKAGFLTRWANGAATRADAYVFSVAPYQPVTNALLRLPAEAVVEGQVWGNFDPLGGATVSVFDADTGKALRSVTLPENEYTYRIGGLPAGHIKVRASKAGWFTGWANGAQPTIATANAFTLVAGQVLQWQFGEVLYIDLQPKGGVEGTILGLNDSPYAGYDDPLPGVRVIAYDARTGVALKSATTDSFGHYVIYPLRPGTVKIRADKAGWLTTWAVGKPSFATADAFGVSFGPDFLTQVPEFPIYAEAVIQGQVLGNFDPLGGARVTVFDADTGVALKSVTADGSGYYRIGGLPAGNIKVRATKTGWVTSWANGKPSMATADVFSLYAGQVLSQSFDPMVLYLDLQPIPVS